MAITAWAAKVFANSICLFVKGCTSKRRIQITPTGMPSRKSGVASIVRMGAVARCTRASVSGNSVSGERRRKSST